jgi:hypothetical protein
MLNKLVLFSKYISCRLYDIKHNPHNYIEIAYFSFEENTDKLNNSNSKKILYFPQNIVVHRYKKILYGYLTRIGFGNLQLGIILSILLLPFTISFLICLIFGFVIFTLPQVLLLPISFGLTMFSIIITCILYGVFAFTMCLVLSSMWISLICAVFGIGFKTSNFINY